VAGVRHEIRSAFVAQSLYRLALLLCSLAAMLDRRGRRVALSNLRVAFGDEFSSERRAQIVRESYQHFSRTMLDFFWSPRLTSQNFSRYGYARSRLSMIVRLRRSQRTS
jgi:lauroyl/myristoyl acyltransferase